MVLLLTLLACDTGPDPCEQLCERAAAQECGCLEQWGADWSDVGYASQEDYFQSCRIWAWELRLLEEDAQQQGLDAHCREWSRALRASPMRCDDWSAADWSEAPWE